MFVYLKNLTFLFTIQSLPQAEALGAQFQSLYPGSTYKLLDIVKEHSHPPYNKLVESYKHLSAHPHQWNLVYKLSNSPPVETLVKTHLKITTEKSVRQTIKKHNPDVVISVHPLMTNVPVASCQKISSETGKHLPMFTVVTDLGSGHCTWFDPGVEKMFIASERIKKLAIKRGKVPEKKLVMSGLPIRKDFAVEADSLGPGGRNSLQGKVHQAHVRQMLGVEGMIPLSNDSRVEKDNYDYDDDDGINGLATHLNDSHKVILVMGGGEGVGSLSSIVDALYVELALQKMHATIVVVCGRNDKLQQSLESRDWNEWWLHSRPCHSSSQSKIQQEERLHKSHEDRKHHGGGAINWKGFASFPLRVFQKQDFDHSSAREPPEDIHHVANGVESPVVVVETKDKTPAQSSSSCCIRVRALGFVQNMAEWMVAADVLITKAGPGTIAEAASVGLPVLLTSFLPGKIPLHVMVMMSSRLNIPAAFTEESHSPI
jgi:1,2-diacylglycerol 3-beta-galactosyltransferase